MFAYAPVVWLTPVVDVAGSMGPLFRVKLPLNWHQVVTHTQGPTRETTLPAWVSVRQPNAGKHIPPAGKKKENEHKDACTHQLSSFPSQVPADDETHRNIPTPSSFPLALCCSPKASTPRVNLIGQCCPSERQACWPGKHCPLVGLVLTGLQPVSGSQFLLGWVSE